MIGAMLIANSEQVAVKIYPFYDPNECCACPVQQQVIKGRPETAHGGEVQLSWRQDTDKYPENHGKMCCQCPSYQGEGVHPYYEKIAKPYAWPPSYPGQADFNNQQVPEYGDKEWGLKGWK